MGWGKARTADEADQQISGQEGRAVLEFCTGTQAQGVGGDGIFMPESQEATPAM